MFQRWERLPLLLLAAAAVLVVLGWVAIARAEELRAQLSGPGSHYLRQQVVYSLVAAAAAVTIAAIDYRRLAPLAYPLAALALAGLIAVFFFPAINGAHRWIRVGPLGGQPSEFAKLVFILAMARFLMHRESLRPTWKLVPPLALALVPTLLILKEPDLGVALVFPAVLVAMLFVAGARGRDLGLLALAALFLSPLVWSGMSREQRSRVVALFEQPSAETRPSEDALHLHQAKRMTALGGVWGSLVAGDACDDPSAYALPEARTDFIFCVVAERLGLWGQALVLTLFAVVVFSGARIAATAREPFGRLVAAGVVALVAVPATINTAMTVGLLPITGIALPMLSYGGSALVAQGVGIGLLCSIALHPGFEVAGEPFGVAAQR